MSVECAMGFEFHPFVGAAFPHAGTRAAKAENWCLTLFDPIILDAHVWVNWIPLGEPGLPSTTQICEKS